MTDKAIIYKDASGAEVNIADFERVMGENHFQMRISRDDTPDSPVHLLATQRNFVGQSNLPPIHLEMFKTDQWGEPIGNPMVEWITNYPFKICRGLMDGIEEGGNFPSDLDEFAVVVRPHPQW